MRKPERRVMKGSTGWTIWWREACVRSCFMAKTILSVTDKPSDAEALSMAKVMALKHRAQHVRKKQADLSEWEGDFLWCAWVPDDFPQHAWWILMHTNTSPESMSPSLLQIQRDWELLKRIWGTAQMPLFLSCELLSSEPTHLTRVEHSQEGDLTPCDKNIAKRFWKGFPAFFNLC